MVPLENTVIVQPAASETPNFNSFNNFAQPTLNGIPPPAHPPLMGTILEAFQGQTHPITVPGLGIIGYSNAPQKKK